LHAALDAADDELRAGKGIPGEHILAALRRAAAASDIREAARRNCVRCNFSL